AGNDVDDAAGGVGHHDMNRPVRIRTFRRCRMIKRECRGGDRDQAEAMDGTHASLPDSSIPEQTTSFERCSSCSFGVFPSTVACERADAAREAENARPAFALDLLGAEAKRGDAAIHRQAIAGLRAIERGGDAKNFPSPF